MRIENELRKKNVEEELCKWLTHNTDAFMLLDVFNEIRSRHNVTSQLMYRLTTKLKIRVGVNIDQVDVTTPNKMSVRMICDVCGKTYITQCIKIQARRYSEWRLCSDHYRSRLVQTDEYRQRNSSAQIIAQNRPESKKKQSLSQKRRHALPGMKEKYENIAKELWKRPSYQESVSRGLRERWKNSLNLQDKCAAGGAYHSQYQGNYKGIRYQSLAELSFILWAEESGHKIERYKLSPVQWIDDEGKSHSYYPDFVLNDLVIVEVKASRRLYGIDPRNDVVEKKFNALVETCKLTQMSARIVYVSEDLAGHNKKRYEHAKIVHESCKASQEVSQAIQR